MSIRNDQRQYARHCDWINFYFHLIEIHNRILAARPRNKQKMAKIGTYAIQVDRFRQIAAICHTHYLMVTTKLLYGKHEDNQQRV